jgi:hypothetical protein
MSHEFVRKWDEIADLGHSAGRFRVLPDHPLDMFIGYSARGERQFTLESSTDRFDGVDLPELENIDITIVAVGNASRLTLTLVSSALKDLFSVICIDLSQASSEMRTPLSAVTVFFSRLNRWAELLRNRRASDMPFKERLGLLGELDMLIWLFDEGVAKSTVVSAWRGPEGDTNDVGLNRVRIEVKAQLSTQAMMLKISSVDQLDSDGRALCVALFRFLPSEHGLSLGSLVADIMDRLASNHHDLLEFQRKLLLSGYSPDAQYTHESFAVDSLRIYEVCDRFPKLIRSNVPFGIQKVNYEIVCEVLGDFEIGQTGLRSLIDGRPSKGV